MARFHEEIPNGWDELKAEFDSEAAKFSPQYLPVYGTYY